MLGLIGACLGLEREDAPAQAALATDYGLALLCHAPGRLLADFHTAQVPSTRRNQRFATRAQELAAPELNTILSRRDYRSGAWHLAALWARGQPRWSLEAIAEAMRNPVFVPYLGRKSCPLGLPLAPDCVEGTDAPAVLMARQARGLRPGLMKSASGSVARPCAGIWLTSPARAWWLWTRPGWPCSWRPRLYRP
ncbi:type I-E CRISPR-associated protein Cas5/CasD [Pseudoroseomonas wenyumeiae]